MKKIIFLLLLITASSCSTNEKALEAKAKHQSESGDRLNQSQKNTESLFKDLENN